MTLDHFHYHEGDRGMFVLPLPRSVLNVNADQRMKDNHSLTVNSSPDELW